MPNQTSLMLARGTVQTCSWTPVASRVLSTIPHRLHVPLFPHAAPSAAGNVNSKSTLAHPDGNILCVDGQACSDFVVVAEHISCVCGIGLAAPVQRVRQSEKSNAREGKTYLTNRSLASCQTRICCSRRCRWLCIRQTPRRRPFRGSPGPGGCPKRLKNQIADTEAIITS